MALKMDEIMDLSLDDYISIVKKTSASNSITNSGSNHDERNTSTGSNDAKFGRRKGNIDDEEDDEEEDFLMKNSQEEIEKIHKANNETGVWKGPDSSISYLDFKDNNTDLREKLNSISNGGNKEKITSVQYRLKAPNNSANRPRGIPTLLPLDAYVNKSNNRNGYRRQSGNRFNFNNLQRNLNSGNKNLSQTNNNRIQRSRKQEFEHKNLRFSVRRDNANKMHSMSSLPRQPQNMIVETLSNYINLNPSGPLNSSFQVPHSSTFTAHNSCSSQSIPVGNITPQAEAKLNLNSCTNSNTTGNESLKNLLGFQGNVSGDMMPVFANRLLDFIQNGLQTQVHKPIYDMKIQKDIHEIQGKPLLYKCPGGEVVSSDGAGVNCKIIPRTSGVSLNCRFA